jgi:hypothetical protein
MDLKIRTAPSPYINIMLMLSLLSTVFHSPSIAASCGRTATVNYQHILVDVSSHQKGEGLRYFLNKDPLAKSYLDDYQEKGRPRWYHAAIGTLGTGIIIAGLTQSDPVEHSGLTSKKTLLASGLLLITLNILIYKTLEHNNERLLIQAIEEYNKRNLPRIYFSPVPDNQENSWQQSATPIFGFIKEF